MTIPVKPSVFSAHGAPVGVEVKFVTFWQQRRVMAATPRLQLVHTNAASGEGSIESAWNWAHARPNANTIPHYQIDRDGRARKMLPTDRVGIANQTAVSVRGEHGTVQDWSLAYETADDGYGAGRLGDQSGFTAAQAETVAQILAYESVTHGIPLVAPVTWWGAGTAAHTDPFGYPYWTTAAGKTCPGSLKKQQLRDQIVPRARQIVAAWTAPPPLTPEDPDMSDTTKPFLIQRNRDGAVFTTDLASWKHQVPWPGDDNPNPTNDLADQMHDADVALHCWNMKDGSFWALGEQWNEFIDSLAER